MFEKRMVRKLFKPKTDEVTRQKRKLHDEEHYDLYSSINIIRMNKPRRIRWAGHVANRRQERCIVNFGEET
jgi:hypothetical protein